ncbi:ornithine decarboxylase antizyme [Lasius niger]|uniref:Ornithine decarboxylase antizyme n=1 Tax=Lasius niger TaxID=67767 RepID=A0A0J7LAQ0_LASNI|nr:ornithine decarboxylase antizyme [Lasius niger]
MDEQSSNFFCHDTQEDELLKAVRSNEPLRLTFTLHLTESTSVEWETVAWRRCLYIRVPSCLLPEGSKEGFVSLLEYAEETLRCTNIIVCLRKDRSDRGTCRLPFFGTNVEDFCVDEKDSPSKSFCCYGLAMLVRTFMFLGFTVLPPTHALVPPGSDAGNLYMLYAIE